VNVAEIHRAIGEELAKHEYCLIKLHNLVVSSGKIVPKHKNEIKTGDDAVGALSQDHIRHGLSSKKWNSLTEAISAVMRGTGSQHKTGDSNGELLFSIFC
jgi:hypothetical protein